MINIIICDDNNNDRRKAAEITSNFMNKKSLNTKIMYSKIIIINLIVF